MSTDPVDLDATVAVEDWWPPSGSCAPSCPHEIAKERRDAHLKARAEQIATDPKLTAEIAEFHEDMETLQTGGVAADELREKWYDRESGANLKMLSRMAKDSARLQRERDEAVAWLREIARCQGFRLPADNWFTKLHGFLARLGSPQEEG